MKTMPIINLHTHHAPFLTIAELAEYWGVSRNQIRKRILSGELQALRLGPHLCRIPTSAAREFERRARVTSGPRPSDAPVPTPLRARVVASSGPSSRRRTR